jgi:hypothetical protein
VQILQNDGFVLVDSGVNEIYDLEYELYGLSFGECRNYVILNGPEEGIVSARTALFGCEEQQILAEMRWLTKLLMFENPREDMDCILMGEFYGWELTKLRDLASGEIGQTELFLGPFDLTARRNSTEDGTTFFSLDVW